MRSKITSNSFCGQSFYIGIDTHKKNWTVTILNEQYEHKTFSQDPDPIILVNYLTRTFPGGNYYAVYEAGFSGFSACRELIRNGVFCSVIHPADVPTSLKEKLIKNDKVDSRKLARSLRSKEFTPIHIPNVQLESDRALVRQRFRLVKEIGRTKNRIKSLLFQFGINISSQFTTHQTRHWSSKFLNWLKTLPIENPSLRQVIDNYIEIGQQLRKQLLIVNRQVRALAMTQRYQKNFELLISIPGVGIITALSFLTQIGDVKRFNRIDDLCSYIGLIPKTYSSGDKIQTGKLIKRGRKEFKIMLIEASWIAIRRDPALMIKFNELCKRMNKNKAIIRIARKILSRMRFVILHQQKYELGVI